MLNVVYKVASKVLASKINKVVPNLIHNDQCGFVKGRFIGEFRTIQDVMYYTKSKDIPGLMIFLDFEKAFDSLEWKFLFKVFECMNFAPGFVRMSILFTQIITCISSCEINTGRSSSYFSVGRGVGQGDPLSPYLFILAIELLSCAIRNDPGIKGIFVEDAEVKIIQYADDGTCIVQDENSAENLFALMSKFTMISGLKLNVSKSQAMWLALNGFPLKKTF